MGLRDRVRSWNVTDAERAASYPCDGYLHGPFESLMRAVDVDAPPEVAFRWLCQLKVGPYSYNPLLRHARRSPRRLTPGVEELQAGQDLLVFRIVEFERDHHISGVIRSDLRDRYGPVAATYLVSPRGRGASRYLVRLDLGTFGTLGPTRRSLLAWGDLVMTRKQLRTLARLAEAQAARGIGTGRSS